MKSNIILIVVYSVIAGLLAALTSPVPGTSLLLTGLEIVMVVHLAKKNRFDLSLKTLGFSATAIWGVSSALKDAGVELLRFAPILGVGCRCDRGGTLRLLFGYFSKSIFRQIKRPSRRTRSFSSSYFIKNNFLPASI